MLQILKKHNKIPLGTTYDGKGVYMRYPQKHGKPISDIILIVGVTGSGKSVIKKNIACFMSRKRPVIMLDPPGRDDFFCYYPNKSRNIPPNTEPNGLMGLYFYYSNPNARKKRQFEITRRPNLRKYSIRELQYLGITETASIFLRNVLETNKSIKSFNNLIKVVEKKGKLLPPLSARTLNNILPYIAQNSNFRLDNKQDVNLMSCFNSGYNLVFSYNDVNLAKLEINYLFKTLIKYRDMYPQGNRPFIFIDEAHKIFGDVKTDEMSKVIEDFVLICRKLSIGLCIVLPEIDSLSLRVLSDIKTMIFGKYKGAKEKLRIILGPDRAKIISGLRFNRYTDDRQFVYYTQDYEYFFIMDKVYESPCEIHRE